MCDVLSYGIHFVFLMDRFLLENSFSIYILIIFYNRLFIMLMALLTTLLVASKLEKYC